MTHGLMMLRQRCCGAHPTGEEAGPTGFAMVRHLMTSDVAAPWFGFFQRVWTLGGALLEQRGEGKGPGEGNEGVRLGPGEKQEHPVEIRSRSSPSAQLL